MHGQSYSAAGGGGGGKVYRELLLVGEQLISGASGGIAKALPLYLTANPAVADTFSIARGATVETWTFVAARSAPFEISIESSPALTLVNMAADISADSVLVQALSTQNLDRYFAAVPATQVVLVSVDTSSDLFRVFGAVTPLTAIRIRNYALALEYTPLVGLEQDLPATDTGVQMFGMSRVYADLRQNEAHFDAENSYEYTWSSGDLTWYQTGSVTAGAGLRSSGRTIYVGDVDKGVQVDADDLQVDAAEISGSGLQQTPGAGNEHLLRVLPDTVGGAGLATVMDVNANGVAVRIDDDTLSGSGNTLHVPDGRYTSLRIERFTLLAGDITAKAVTLASTPKVPARVLLGVKSGPTQHYGDDYQMVGATAALSWAGLGLDGVLSAGDKLTIIYDI